MQNEGIDRQIYPFYHFRDFTKMFNTLDRSKILCFLFYADP